MLESNERFQVTRQLGSGGMGSVFAAYDNQRETPVAVKTLHDVDATHILAIKQEFRQRSGLSHPNLIQLYDLLYLEENWFLSMELVEGMPFLDAARPASRPDADPDPNGYPGPTRTEAFSRDDSSRRFAGPVVASNEEVTRTMTLNTESRAAFSVNTGTPGRELQVGDQRIARSLLQQLATGLHALHSAGRLHCDVKPSNVLVTGDERVVILDFGLIKRFDGPGTVNNQDSEIAGTAPYAAPEQMKGHNLSPAADWYSFGVILYELLTGVRPFSGTFEDVLEAKCTQTAPLPEAMAPGLPSDLCHLCTALLNPESDQRPGGIEVLHALGVGSEEDIEREMTDGTPRSCFVGRTADLARLESAAEQTRAESRATVLWCHGKSGMGKTALVQHFLNREAQKAETIVLSSKCFEFESVPYKAFDSLIDNLSLFLLRMEAGELNEVLPADVGPLVLLFPILKRVEPLKKLAEKPDEQRDVVDVRRRAFRALHDLFENIGRRYHLILFLDDLQWGDLDSAQLLHDLLQPPNPAAMTVILSYRTEDRERSRCLQKVFELQSLPAATLAQDTIEVSALSVEDSCEVARELLKSSQADRSDQLLNGIAEESRGNPFFLQVLCTYYQYAEEKSFEQVDLTKALGSTLYTLSLDARRMVEAVAIAGYPLPSNVAFQFVSESIGQVSVLHELTARKFIKVAGSHAGEELEPFHDRIREFVEGTMQRPRRKALHLELAGMLEAEEDHEPEILAYHYLGGEETALAGAYFEQAGDKASSQLAFDRAATFYEQAIEYLDLTEDRNASLQERLAEALGNTGRGPEAAERYLCAVRSDEPARGLELKRKAAMHYLLSGHLQKGEAVLEEPLSSAGLKLPSTQSAAIRILIAGRIMQFFRGYDFRKAKVDDLSEAQRFTIELLWTTHVGLAIFDPVRASAMSTLHMRETLRAGEPFRLVRALSWHANSVTITKREQLLDTARELAEEVGDPFGLGLERLCRGINAYLELRFDDALDAFAESKVHLRRCHGITFEFDTLERFEIYSLVYTGKFVRARASLDELLRDARERGDQYARINWSAGLSILARLSADDPVATRKELVDCMSGWRTPTFTLQHCTALLGKTYIDLYEGKFPDAFNTLHNAWKTLMGSKLLSVPMVKVIAINLHAALKLQQALMNPAKAGSLRRSARRDLRTLRRMNYGFAPGLADHLEAGLKFASGDRDGAVQLLHAASASLRKLQIMHYAAACEFVALRLSGSEWTPWLAEWIETESISNPDRYMRVLCPGFETAHEERNERS